MISFGWAPSFLGWAPQPVSSAVIRGGACDGVPSGLQDRLPLTREVAGQGQSDVTCCQPPSEPTARAITSSDVSSAAVASMPMSALARVESGMVSVGLNALELVSETYR